MLAADTSASGKGPDPVDIHVGARVRLARSSQGISQGALGRMLGVTFQQVQKYESGANRVSASKLQKISETLAVPPAFFFEGLSAQSQTHDAETVPNRSLVDFVSTKDGRKLVGAFMGIDDAGLRKRILDLVDILSRLEIRRGVIPVELFADDHAAGDR